MAALETDGGEESSSVVSASLLSSSEVSWEDEEEECDKNSEAGESIPVSHDGIRGKENSRPPAPAEAKLTVSADFVRVEQGGGSGELKDDAREWANGKMGGQLASVAKATLFAQRLGRAREQRQGGAQVGAGGADTAAFLRTQGV